MDGALDSYNDIEKEKINVLRVLREIGRALGNDLVLERLLMSPQPVVRVVDRTGYADPNLQPTKKVRLEGVLTLSFPSSINPESGVREVDALAQRISENLTNYTVEVTKQVADLSYTGNVTGQSGGDESGNPVDFKAEIKILEKQ